MAHRRAGLIVTLASAILLVPLAAVAQQPAKVPRIGVLSNVRASDAGPRDEALRQGLREKSWVDGQNVVIEYRYADNELGRLPALAADLIRLGVDVIVAPGTPAPLAARAATTTIPIVMAAAGDPVASGLVASLTKPGGNVTGLSVMAPELGGKRLQLLKEVIPRLSRVAVLWNAANPYPGLVVKETEAAARTLGVQVQSVEVRGLTDFDGAFSTVSRGAASALLVVEDPLTLGQRGPIVEFAARARLPAIYGLREFADAGGLMAYGAHLPELYRRAAGYVDKILRGAKPADLPVEQPTKFEFVINLKTAKALGLTIPQSVLLRADEVIE